MIRDTAGWIIALIFFCSVSEAQDTIDRIQIEDASFSELIDVLEKSYDVHFSYQSDLLNDQVFSLNTNTPDLANILQEITAIYNLEYQLLNDQSILLRNKLGKIEDLTDAPYKVKVIDNENGQPLANAAVGVPGTSIGAYTDESGSALLILNKEQEDVKFEAFLLGYESRTISCGPDKLCEIRLGPQSFDLEEVMIKHRTDIIDFNKQDHSVSITSRNISALAGGVMGKDIIRQTQLMAGVAAFNDVSAGLRIRGAEEQSSLIVIDNIPVYNATHYYGLFGAINPSYSTNGSLYKNNLPIDYDGKTAGMLHINGPQLDDDASANGTVDLNLLSVSGALHVPVFKDANLSIAGRTSHSNVSDTDLFSLFDNRSEGVIQNFSDNTRNQLVSSIPDFTFYDINARFDYRWSKGSIALSYFQSKDDLNDTFQNSFTNGRNQIRVQNTETYSNLEKWTNKGFSAEINSKITPALEVMGVIYSTKYNNQSGLDISLNRQFPREIRSFNYNNVRENQIDDTGIKFKLTHESDLITASGGIEVIAHEAGLDVLEQSEVIRSSGRSETESSGFISIAPKLSKGLHVELGFRGTLYNDDFYSSPRINVSYEVSDAVMLKGSYGRHNQFVRQISFENLFGRSLDFWVLSDHNNFPVSRSNNVMLGGTIQQGNFTVDIESYYRKMNNVVDLALVNPRLDQEGVFLLSQMGGNQYKLFTGDGSVLGVDLTLGWTGKRYAGALSYTLSKSTIQYDQILRGTAFPAQDDRRHQLKLINDIRLGKFTIGGNFIYTSGRPYTDLNKISPSIRRDELRPGERISRLPSYVRTDLAFSYDISIGNHKGQVGISAYNLLDRSNVNYIQYLFSLSNDQQNGSFNTLLGTESNLLGRTVNVNFSMNF